MLCVRLLVAWEGREGKGGEGRGSKKRGWDWAKRADPMMPNGLFLMPSGKCRMEESVQREQRSMTMHGEDGS